jgi:hypothetical protein
MDCKRQAKTLPIHTNPMLYGDDRLQGIDMAKNTIFQTRAFHLKK